jgi:hypothetical protein
MRFVASGSSKTYTKTQQFTLLVVPSSTESVPAITSANQTTFAVGLVAGNGLDDPYNFFKVTTTGSPIRN